MGSSEAAVAGLIGGDMLLQGSRLLQPQAGEGRPPGVDEGPVAELVMGALPLQCSRLQLPLALLRPGDSLALVTACPCKQAGLST